MARARGLSAGGIARCGVPPLGPRLDLRRNPGADQGRPGRVAPGSRVRTDLSAQPGSAPERCRMTERPEQLRLLEALLFAAPEPLTEDDLARRLGDTADVTAL